MQSLTEKVVIITGAGSGIGKAAAAAFAARGARVVLVGRRQAVLDRVVAELSASLQSGQNDLNSHNSQNVKSDFNTKNRRPGQLWAFAADIARRSEVNALIGWAIGEFGRVDILVNNAGSASRTLNARWIEEEEWDQVQEVNLKAVFLLTQAVLPGMLSQQNGTIITVSSLAALRPNLLGGAAYGAAKAGVRNFMTYLHNTFRNEGIRSTSILPGEVNTPIMDNRANPPDVHIRENMVQPEDVAEAILLCASLPSRTVIEELIVAPTYQRDISGDLEVSRWKNAPPSCQAEREKSR